MLNPQILLQDYDILVEKHNHFYGIVVFSKQKTIVVAQSMEKCFKASHSIAQVGLNLEQNIIV